MDSSRIIDFLITYDSDLRIAKLWWSILRDLGWMLLRAITGLLDALNTGQSEFLKLMDFYRSPQVLAFIIKYKYLAAALAVCSIGFLAYKMINAGSSEERSKFPKYLDNIILAVIISVGLPMGLSMMMNVFSVAANQEVNSLTTSIDIYKNNITDLYAVDKAGWQTTGAINSINDESDLLYFNISEPVDTGSFFFDDSPLSQDGRDILSKQLTEVDGEVQAINLSSHWFNDDDAYFRYSWNYPQMLLESLIKLIVVLFTLFKIAQFAIELGVLNGFVSVSVWTDLAEGQRNKGVLLKMRNILVVLFCVIVIQTIYSYYCAYITRSDLTTIFQLIAMIAGGFFVIQGPGFIEEFFGYDAGVKGGFGGLYALNQGAMMGSSLVRAPFRATRGVSRAAGKATGGIISKARGGSGKRTPPNPGGGNGSNPSGNTGGGNGPHPSGNTGSGTGGNGPTPSPNSNGGNGSNPSGNRGGGSSSTRTPNANSGNGGSTSGPKGDTGNTGPRGGQGPRGGDSSSKPTSTGNTGGSGTTTPPNLSGSGKGSGTSTIAPPSPDGKEPSGGNNSSPSPATTFSPNLSKPDLTPKRGPGIPTSANNGKKPPPPPKMRNRPN